MVEADLLALQHLGAGDLGQRPGGGDLIEGGGVVDAGEATVDPDAEPAILAPHRLDMVGAAHHHHHVAGALDGAEQQHVGPGEAGGDGHQMLGQVGHQRFGGTGRHGQSDRSHWGGRDDGPEQGEQGVTQVHRLVFARRPVRRKRKSV